MQSTSTRTASSKTLRFLAIVALLLLAVEFLLGMLVNLFVKLRARCQHETTSFLLSLHHDSQVHTGVDSTVEMECSGSGEGADGVLTEAVDLHVLDLRSARLSGRFRRTIFPCSVRNGVGDQRIINQCDTLPLFDVDG